MQRMLAGILSAIALFNLSGCTWAVDSPSGVTMTAGSDDRASQRWRTSGDYYALLELVNAHIDPQWNHRVSKADVVKFIGKGIHDPDGYPNAGPNFWVYISNRPTPIDSYLYVEFANDGFVKSVSWGSE